MAEQPSTQDPSFGYLKNPFSDCLIPFNIQIGDMISPEITKMFNTLFKKIQFIDVEKFEQINSYRPCISSSFKVCDGGSISYDDMYDGKKVLISIHNGTLQYIMYNNSPDLKELLDLKFSITVGEYNKIYTIFSKKNM